MRPMGRGRNHSNDGGGEKGVTTATLGGSAEEDTTTASHRKLPSNSADFLVVGWRGISVADKKAEAPFTSWKIPPVAAAG